MQFLCDVFVRPLACKNKDDFWEQRWPDHPHLMALTQALGIKFVIHDVKEKYYVTPFGRCPSHGQIFHLLYTGCHYQLLYK